MIVKDHGGSWWVGPLGVQVGDETWLSGVERRGANVVTRIVGGVPATVVLDGPTQADEHNAAGLAVDADQPTVLAGYARHNADSDIHVQHIDRSTLALGTQQVLPMGGLVTYAQLFHAPGSATVHLLCRVAEDNWRYRTSPDWGSSWGPARTLFDGAGLGKIYVATRRDLTNPTLVHMVAAGHPLHSPMRKVRYARIDLTTGEVSKLSGSVLGNLGDTGGPAITETSMDLVVAPSSAYRVRTLDVGRVSGQPAVAYVIWKPDDATWPPLYKVKRWDGSDWSILDWELESGPVFGHTSGAHYHGGVGLGEDGATMRTSSKQGDWWIIQEWDYASGAYTLASEVARSRDVLIRPYPIRGGAGWLRQDGVGYGSITRYYMDLVVD